MLDPVWRLMPLDKLKESKDMRLSKMRLNQISSQDDCQWPQWYEANRDCG